MVPLALASRTSGLPPCSGKILPFPGQNIFVSRADCQSVWEVTEKVQHNPACPGKTGLVTGWLHAPPAAGRWSQQVRRGLHLQRGAPSPGGCLSPQEAELFSAAARIWRLWTCRRALLLRVCGFRRDRWTAPVGGSLVTTLRFPAAPGAWITGRRAVLHAAGFCGAGQQQGGREAGGGRERRQPRSADPAWTRGRRVGAEPGRAEDRARL